MMNESIPLDVVRDILEGYDIQITVRQLYYRMVAAGVIPNNQRSYKRLVAQTTKWRKDRSLDLNAFNDLTREVIKHDEEGSEVDDPTRWARGYMLGGIEAAQQYKLKRWFGQRTKVIVAVEKQALQGPFEQVCAELEVDLMVMRGYPSLSFLRDIADRIEENDLRTRDGEMQETVLLYFGDYDPSGINIPESIEENLRDFFSLDFTMERIALNEDQVAQMNLIPAPVKMTDSRAATFIERHGTDVYELDAVEPRALQLMIRQAIAAYWSTNIGAMADSLAQQGREEITRKLRHIERQIRAWTGK